MDGYLKKKFYEQLKAGIKIGGSYLKKASLKSCDHFCDLGTFMKKECWDHEGIPKSLIMEWPDLKYDTQQNEMSHWNDTKWNDNKMKWHQMKWQ